MTLSVREKRTRSVEKLNLKAHHGTPEGLETLHVRSGHTHAWLLTRLLRSPAEERS